VQTFKQNMD